MSTLPYALLWSMVDFTFTLNSKWREKTGEKWNNSDKDAMN